MKRNYVVLGICVIFFVFLFFYLKSSVRNVSKALKTSEDIAFEVVSSPLDLKGELDLSSYDAFKFLNNEKTNYVKNYYVQDPPLKGISIKSVDESWQFLYPHDGKDEKYFIFQQNSFLDAKTADDEFSTYSYALSLYDSQKNLVSEVSYHRGFLENTEIFLYKQGDNVIAEIAELDKDLKLVKKRHKSFEDLKCEYIDSFANVLALKGQEYFFNPHKKPFCLYSEKDMVIKDDYAIEFVKNNEKSVDEPWDLEYKEFDADGEEAAYVYFDTQDNIILRVDSPPMNLILTDKKRYDEENKSNLERKVARSVYTDFWLTDHDNIESLEAVVEFDIAYQKEVFENSPRQKVEKLSDYAFRITLLNEDLSLPALKKEKKDKIQKALQSNTSVPSDNPKIVALSKEITKNGKDNLEKSFQIMNWIKDNIKWTYDSNTDVLQTLETRKGDCTERASLFVALARAAGIPAEGAGGFVFTVDSISGHQWVKIYENNRWIEIDPSTVDFITATYLRDETLIFPENVKKVKINKVKYKDKPEIEIDYEIPMFTWDEHHYSNRVLGLDFTIPKYAQILASEGIEAILFEVRFRQSIFNLKDLMKNSPIEGAKIFVGIGDYSDEVFNFEKEAQDAQFYGARSLEKKVIENSMGKFILDYFSFGEENGLELYGCAFSYPVDEKYLISFIVFDDVKHEFDVVPPLFVEILKGTKYIEKKL